MAPSDFIAWLPITDEERQQKAPLVEKDAGAEILLWRAHVVDELLGNNRDLQRVVYNYVRLKIFDEKGKEKAATIDLPYREPGAILDVTGRTIKTDGSVAELDPKTVYRRDLIRSGGRSVKAVSFAMPGVEPGAIVEYRWKQTENDNRFRYLRLNFAREFPAQKVTYFLKPLSGPLIATDQMFLVPFNCKTSSIRPTADGWNETSVTNVPASHEEPYAPSDPNIEPWALLYYREGGPNDPEKYWNDYGRKTYGDLKAEMKGGSEEKAAAAEAMGSAKTEDEKISALVSYIRKKLRNVYDRSVTDAERDEFLKKLPKDHHRSSSEILKGELATAFEMNVAFAAVGMQAGLDVRPALVASSAEIMFNPKAFNDHYFLENWGMAVKIGDSWKVFDVTNRHLAPGMLPWEEEGVYALITDPKTPVFVRTAVSPPEASAETRVAKLQLSADASLEGDIEEVYTGHRAEDYRNELESQSPAQREKWLQDRVVRMFPEAEVTSIKLENVDDASKPLRAVYHLEAPLFAQVTGKRILFQPNAFRRGQAARLSASERRFPVEFPYGWKESDEIHIQLPDGFALDNADAPGNVNFGEPGSYQFNMSVKKGPSTELIVNRSLTFGNKGLLIFPKDVYPLLKKIFETVQANDAHSIALKAN